MSNLKAFSEARQRADDEEIARLEGEIQEEQEIKEIESQAENIVDAEEQRWHKRYADLRRHESAKEAKHREEVERLKAEIEKARRSSGAVPVTREELEDYIETYPKVGALITQIVNDQLENRLKGQEDKLSQLDELKAEREYQKAKDALAALEPDFFGNSKGELQDGSLAIVKRQDFHDWVESKENDPNFGWVFDAIYNSTNTGQAVAAITMWKAESGFSSPKPASKKTKPKSNLDAASSVRTTGKPSVKESSKGDYDFTESQIGKMSNKEYDKYEEAIEEARLAGRILYDVSLA